MESTDQVIHQLEMLTLETGTVQKHASSSTHISVTEVIHHISSSSGSNTSTTHSARPNTQDIVTGSSGTVFTTTTGVTAKTTTNSTRHDQTRRQEAYRIHSSNHVNVVRAQAVALGHVHVPPLVSGYHEQYRAKIRNRSCVAQRIYAFPKSSRAEIKVICRKNEAHMKTYKLNRLREARRAAIIAVMSP